MTKQRDTYWDIVKGVTILIVIFGHQLQNSCGHDGFASGLFYEDIMFKIVYSFHMPLFMLVSGYFFFYSVRKYDAKELIKNKSIQLVLPIFTVSTMLFLIGLEYSLKSFVVGFISYLWFLWSVFYLSIFVLIVHQWLKDNIWIFIIGFFITFFIPELYISPRVMYMYPYFICGYLFNKYGLFEKMFESKLPIIFVICLISYIVLLMPFNRETYIYVSGYQVIDRWWQFLVDLHRMAIGFCGSFLLIIIIRMLYNHLKGIWKYTNTIINYLGQNTLQLYVISTLPFFRIIVWHYSDGTMNYMLTLLATLFVTLLSIIIIEIIKRYKLTNFLLFGQIEKKQ